jgi:hypothetical protein
MAPDGRIVLPRFRGFLQGWGYVGMDGRGGEGAGAVGGAGEGAVDGAGELRRVVGVGGWRGGVGEFDGDDWECSGGVAVGGELGEGHVGQLERGLGGVRVIGRIHDLAGAPDAVRDGRHVMENDGKGEPPHVPFYVFYGSPEHPNYREVYQRMGEQTT